MCGITGYVGSRPAVRTVVDMLRRLEYRGYDSAGVAVAGDADVSVVKAAGKLAVLEGLLSDEWEKHGVAIAHTRWATHGGPTTPNAHPHYSGDGTIALIHNGIIENYQELKTILTIPSLAFFALMLPLVGIGNTAPIIALTGYALLPIARNTLAGLRSVDPAVVESARGMGMSGTQRLIQMELPVAWPVILTGIRVATLLTVGIAAVAVLVGGDGLGDEIYSGIRRLGSAGATEALFGGTLAILVIALAFDAVYQFIGRLTTSKGLQ